MLSRHRRVYKINKQSKKALSKQRLPGIEDINSNWNEGTNEQQRQRETKGRCVRCDVIKATRASRKESPTCSQFNKTIFSFQSPLSTFRSFVVLFHSWARCSTCGCLDLYVQEHSFQHHSNLLCAYVAIDHSHRTNTPGPMWNTWARDKSDFHVKRHAKNVEKKKPKNIYIRKP